MARSTDLRIALVKIATAAHRQLYRETRNPMHVWAAYLQARPLCVRELPDWILTYLDRTAQRLCAPAGTENPIAIAKALGLATKGGGPSARTRAITAKRALAVRQRVALRRARGETANKAIHAVAHQVGLSPDRVEELTRTRKRRRRQKRGQLQK